MRSGKLIVGITGASGAIYARRFLLAALSHFREIYVTVTEQALQVFEAELGERISRYDLTTASLLGQHAPQVKILDEKDYFTPPASGSFRHEGMVVIPCSMGTLARIANGISNDLLTRAADVSLKERRKLILVVRETPYNLVMLRNMTAVTEAGAVVLPASPAWYYRPQTVEELADTVVARVLQNLGIEQNLVPQWQTEM